MDVCLHYKGDQDKSNELVSISEKALEDFPRRVLPIFTPWFPSGTDVSCAIKPKKAPPVISFHQQKSDECFPQQPEFVFSSSRCTYDHEKFVDTGKRKLISSPTSADEHTRADFEDVAKKRKRSWSVLPPKTKTPQRTQDISRHLQKTVQRYGLDLHQRAKWIISELNCAPQSIEEVWSKLSHAINHAKLPTCNANYQRNLIQIWVYCDISYCEYIGNFLRETFQLSGELTLAVHKLGDIFKL
ncbi:shieldin complex subunit 3 [Hemibagrus wyckioides]|uniref:shieldin complex subunit 3 n=1 Tax=Hemibagrus wyckioides TaxID=337641 RepID=UPI00266BD1D2|nr:shieldin complex subunit 3 [Hemibagrus wyckioides]XP_058245470.1 shieldin complex subunit 3 [Hemibagrus wyckioides]XP_058245471.1 shieldin complex subunit 3 [Hemibagrus wyckioides]XP_058245473.1 shieldin complex subunit 3 [Hemibagrus wyckioides]